MSQTMKTTKCVKCGDIAVLWHGHVLKETKGALKVPYDVQIVAGFCENCIPADSEGPCYGRYDEQKMGECVPLFKHENKDLEYTQDGNISEV